MIMENLRGGTRTDRIRLRPNNSITRCIQLYGLLSLLRVARCPARQGGGDKTPQQARLANWPCYPLPYQAFLRLFASAAEIAGKFTVPVEGIEVILVLAYDPIARAIVREQWKRWLRIVELDVDGVLLWQTGSQLVRDLVGVYSDPRYFVGVNCPCRRRDGFGRPASPCPD